MAKYTVQNAQGKKVTFEWSHATPPTDTDMEEVFAAAEAAVPAPAPGPPVSEPVERVESPIFPSAANIPGQGALPSIKRIGSGVLDLVNIPTRAAATLRGQSMSDPESYFFRPEAEVVAEKFQAQGEKMAKTASELPSKTWEDRWAQGQEFNRAGQSMAAATLAPIVGQIISDPTLAMGKAASLVGRIGSKGMEAARAVVPKLKNYVSGLARIESPLLEKAATPAGLATLKEGARMKPEELAKQIADDAGSVNRFRDDLATNSKATQQQQVQSINDQLALENQGINSRLEAEAANRNEFQDNLRKNSQITQQKQTEEQIAAARRSATGATEATLGEIKPGALGEDIKSTVLGSKAEMQDAWVKGDQESVGPLRDAKAPDVTLGRGKSKVTMKLLTHRLGEVLEKYKAADPSAGMRKISEGGTAVIRDIIGHAEQSGHTVDDLLNIKAELRRARNLDKYKGIPFDASVDDVAFGDADREIASVIDHAIAEADPEHASDIMGLMKAKDRQYAITKDLLGDQARSLNQTQNTANIIQKVKAMGPEKARELIAGAESNAAIASLVPKLRQAFVDDLILSSMKEGEFSAEAMSKAWLSPTLQETKAAWLAKEDIKRIDDALALGTAEMGKPAVARTTKVPMPARLGTPADRSDGFYNQLARIESDAPPKVGRSFSFDGKPDPVTAKSRVENIGNENEINQRAMADLKVLDKINGTDHAEKAMKIFEAGKLGMSEDGMLASHPMQTTGARGYGAQKGKIVGGLAGGLLGIAMDHGFGAAAGGGAAGAFVGDVIASMHSNLASPAGAVAAYRKMNAVLEARFPRAAALAAEIQKTTDKAKRARLLATLATELQKAQNDDSTARKDSIKPINRTTPGRIER